MKHLQRRTVVDQTDLQRFVDNAKEATSHFNNWLIEENVGHDDEYDIQCLWIAGFLCGNFGCTATDYGDRGDLPVQEMTSAIRNLPDGEELAPEKAHALVAMGVEAVVILAKALGSNQEDMTVVYYHPEITREEACYILKASLLQVERNRRERN